MKIQHYDNNVGERVCVRACVHAYSVCMIFVRVVQFNEIYAIEMVLLTLSIQQVHICFKFHNPNYFTK